MLPKLLVVDKSVFHTFYNCDEKLCEFVKKYNVVLPHTLAIECVISENKSGKEQNKEPDKLFRVLVKAIKAGANLGNQSPELLKMEKKTLCPIKTIIDEVSTLQLRNSPLEISLDLIKQKANSYITTTKRKTGELLERARRLYEVISENEEFTKLSRKLTKREERYQKWIQIMDHNNLVKNVMKTDFTEKISSRANANWYTWQCTRLWFAYLLDWSHKKSLHGSSEKKDISNDFYDIEPVLYLLRADGLLTNDTKLEIPLAKAAFPKKVVFEMDTTLNTSRTVQHVFTDIVNKIPQSYRI